jgi:hypothetical protein
MSACAVDVSITDLPQYLHVPGRSNAQETQRYLRGIDSRGRVAKCELWVRTCLMTGEGFADFSMKHIL